tara:strand:- start:28 stop:393 length:366 start_codon:yes stop_codon:yes gene_type:complete
MNYKFSVTGLRREDHNEFKDVVTHLQWRLVGTDSDELEGTFCGATPIEDLSQLDVLTFVEFSELKEETIIEWIEAMLGHNPSYKEHILEQIAKEIEDKRLRTTTNAYDLPWAGEPPEPIAP